MFKSTLPSSDQIESVQFVSLPEAQPIALAVSSRQGTHFQVVPLVSSSTAVPVVVEFKSPASEQNFGHSFFHAKSSTLFVSSSSRGSLFAFHIALTDSAALPTQHNDAAYFSTLSSVKLAATLRIDHVLETATPELIISFLLDESNVLENELSAICIHPNGIHQVAFAHSSRTAVQEDGEDEDEEGMEVGPERRMSLEGCISVAVETEVRPGSPAAKELEVVEEFVAVKVEEDIAIEASTINVPEELLVKQEPVVEAPIAPVAQSFAATTGKATKANKNSKSSNAESNGPKSQADLVNAAWANGRAASPVSKKSGGGGGAKDKGKEVAKEHDGSAEVLKELRKLEETLPGKIAKIVQEEMEKQGQPSRSFESYRR